MAERLTKYLDSSCRYNRQESLPEVGRTGQGELKKGSVLVVGAGGLGVPASLYLAGAGIGTIGIIDHDHIEVTNLHRQVIYTETQIGQSKSYVLTEHLKKLNSDIQVISYQERLLSTNAAALIEQYDVIVDAADNFLITYLLSDLCLMKNKALVTASVIECRGYIGVFCNQAPSYRALFPDVPEQAKSCSDAGVLGPVVGVLGNMLAQEAIKLILRSDTVLRGQLQTIDLWKNRQKLINFKDALEPVDFLPIELIDQTTLTNSDTLIDVRSESESQSNPVERAINIPLSELSKTGVHPSPFMNKERVVFFCVSGRRAAQAALSLRQHVSGKFAVMYRG